LDWLGLGFTGRWTEGVSSGHEAVAELTGLSGFLYALVQFLITVVYDTCFDLEGRQLEQVILFTYANSQNQHFTDEQLVPPPA